MILLPNGCKRTEFNVYPKNWKTARAKISIAWYADCKFIDPSFLDTYPNGKSIRLKRGVNRFKTIQERKIALETLISEFDDLVISGYNPIATALNNNSKNIEMQQKKDLSSELLPNTKFIDALRIALNNSTNVRECVKDMYSVVKSIESAAETLSYLDIAIGDIEVKHIKRCLDHCHKTNSKFSAKRYNKAKAYLSSLFRYLIQEGAVQGNMARAVNPMREEISQPKYFTEDEIERIKTHLWTYNRPFYNFMMMFYYSGGRIKELMRLQRKDVNLNEQSYSTLVKKGKPRWVSRTIRNVAMPYWIEQLKNCGQNDYVFSENLTPGVKQIGSEQVSRRWRTHVKKPLGIETTIYKLKHLNTDRTLKAFGAKLLK